MSRGFGATFGAGTTDKIAAATTISSSTTLLNFSFNAYVNGTGGSAAGRMLVIGNESINIANNATTSSLKITVNFTTTAGVFTCPIGPAATWQNVVITYDGSNVANKPSVYVNGVAKLVTVATPPVGTISFVNSVTIFAGNRLDGTRNFDGMLSHVCVWTGALLSDGAALALGTGSNPAHILPEYLNCYLPLDGVNNPEFDYGGKPTISITGTRLGTSEAPTEAVFQDEDMFWPANTAGATDYALALASGTYTITGNAATLTYASSGTYTLALGAGSYSITGNSMSFTAPNNAGKAGWYQTPYQIYKENEYLQKQLRQELVELDAQIAQTEIKKPPVSNADIEEISAMQAELEASLQDEINRLRMERVWLMRRIEDEEAILALLLSMPLH